MARSAAVVRRDFFDPNTKIGRLRQACLDKLHEHERAGALPTNGRFVFYELEMDGVIPKAYFNLDGSKPTRQPAQDITDALMDLRDAGYVPWEWLTDETRAVSAWSYHQSRDVSAHRTTPGAPRRRRGGAEALSAVRHRTHRRWAAARDRHERGQGRGEAGGGVAADGPGLEQRAQDRPRRRRERHAGAVTFAGGEFEDLGEEDDLADDTVPPEEQGNGKDEDPFPERPWPVMDPAAYHGIAGEIVRAIGPTSEADPVALLLNVLTFFGSCVGHGAYWTIEATRHYLNLFVLTVGRTARARKGTATNRIKPFFKIADPGWFQECINEGELSSGEGYIDVVRDDVYRLNRKGLRVLKKEGVTDKRRLFIQSEFSGALTVMRRDGSILETVMINAWDSKEVLETNVKQENKVKATGAHISNLGHITIRNLLDQLTTAQIASGFANRNLFALVERSKRLPRGGKVNADVLADFGDQLESLLLLAKTVGEITWTPQAGAEWDALYAHLSRDRVGLVDDILARAEAQVTRLAGIYALLDGRAQADSVHLKAALAVWDYCEASVERLFGGRTGNKVADVILTALRQAPKGLTRTAISGLFGRNRDSTEIEEALAPPAPDRMGEAGGEEQGRGASA